MQILGLLGMYFDAVVLEVEKSLLFFRLALAILWNARYFDEFYVTYSYCITRIFFVKLLEGKTIIIKWVDNSDA